MVARIGFPVPKSALAAFVVAVASLLAPPSYAMQVAPIEPVVWDTASGGNGHTYLYVPLPYTTSWAAANAKAETITLPDGSEGYLATITSEEERAFIRNAVLPVDGANPISAVWIAPENQYMLVNGEHPSNGSVSPEHWSYGKWSSENEPGEHGSIHKRFLTKWMNKHGHDHGDGSHDGCGDENPPIPTPKILGMIVEFDPVDVPEPAAALLSAFGIALLALYCRRS